jgi:protein KRI1
MPTRFKYATSAPQNFGLTPAEILMADDKDLNQYMGIKKYAPYRKGSAWDNQRPERLKEFKQKLENKRGKADVESEEKPAKKRKGKKERQKLKAAAVEGSAEMQVDEPAPPPVEKKRKRKEGAIEVEDPQAQESTKKKRRHRKSALTG